MKVLFLDIDGVVNCSATRQRFMGCWGIDPKLVAIVKDIIKKTGCKVVLSSSWRLDADFNAEARKKVCDFIDITPDNRGRSDRGCEVIAWLAKHKEVEAYAILDDNSDFHNDQHLFRTDILIGITPAIADKVIAHLNN